MQGNGRLKGRKGSKERRKDGKRYRKEVRESRTRRKGEAENKGSNEKN